MKYRIGEQYIVNLEDKNIRIEIEFIDIADMIWVNEMKGDKIRAMRQLAFTEKQADIYFQSVLSSVHYMRKL